jgi:hypothetical protein
MKIGGNVEEQRPLIYSHILPPSLIAISLAGKIINLTTLRRKVG